MRAVAQVVKKLLLAFAAVVTAASAFKFLLLPAIEFVAQPGPTVASFLRRAGILLCAVFGYWIYVKFRENRAATELRIAPLGMLAGALSGAALISITTLVLFALGNYESIAWRGVHGELLGVAGMIVLAAVLEEIVFRGILFRILEETCGTIAALWLSSVIFAVAHLWNFEPDTSPLLLITTVVAATLISAFWALLFARWRNLWIVAMHHAAWNFAIILSGAPLSGLEEWRSLAPLETRYHGPAWLTGAIFGPEDSIITIVVIAVCVAVLLHFIKSGNRLVHARAMPPDGHVARLAMRRPVSPRTIAASLTELWSPRVVAEVDESYVKVARVQGTFGWHSHDAEDELFLVLAGRLHIETDAGAVDLAEGDCYVVPKGLRHNPVAADECLLMLIERKSTQHAGGTRNEKTRSLAEQLRPV